MAENGSDPNPSPAPAPADPTPDPNPAPGPTPPDPTPDPNAGGTSRADERIRELTGAKSEAEKQRDEALARLKEIEERDLSEKEKAEKRAAEAEQKAQEAEQRATTLERSSWIRSAAASANFANSEDAVELLHSRLGDLDSETKVQNAVKKLAEDRPHLVRAPAVPAGFGAPLGGGFGAPPAGEEPPGPGGELTLEQAKGGIAQDIGSILSGRRRG